MGPILCKTPFPLRLPNPLTPALRCIVLLRLLRNRFAAQAPVDGPPSSSFYVCRNTTDTAMAFERLRVLRFTAFADLARQFRAMNAAVIGAGESCSPRETFVSKTVCACCSTVASRDAQQCIRRMHIPNPCQQEGGKVFFCWRKHRARDQL